MPLPEHVRGYLIRLLERDAAERAQADAELDELARLLKYIKRGRCRACCATG